MSEYCEVSESVALAVSTCPATDVVAVLLSSAASHSSTAGSGPQPYGVITSTAAASAAAFPEAVALLGSTGVAVGTASASVQTHQTAASSAKAKSTAVLAFNVTALSSAAAAGAVLGASASNLLSSTASASSTVSGQTSASRLLTSTCVARSSTALGLLEVAAESAAATSTATGTRAASIAVASDAVATGVAFPTTTVGFAVLHSSGAASSSTTAQLVGSLTVGATASGAGEALYRDPLAKAWVMNTETAAASWYDSFGFESIAQVGDRTLAVGPEGLYELAGGRDDGVRIAASTVSGVVDFGSAQTKRLENMYFGYTSEGQLAASVEAYESGHPPSTYLLEQRAASAPRNSRLTPGKGLWGRYWRLTLSNVDGADFKVHDASVDIAVSSRRI